MLKSHDMAHLIVAEPSGLVMNITFSCYRKNPKISDTRKFAVITLKVELDGFSLE